LRKYKFDPHTHTSESSHCGLLTAAELVEAYHAHGYAGIAITDHVCEYYCSGFDNWADAVHNRLIGYKAAKKRGDELGLDVILGIELRFNINWSDYLIYGIDENFLLANPHPYKLTPKDFYKRHGSDVLIIQAHPYRDITQPPFTESIHGIEVYNGNPRHNNNDKKVHALCKKFPSYYLINGSDAHEPQDVGGEWININRRVTDSFQLRDAIIKRQYTLGRKPKGLEALV